MLSIIIWVVKNIWTSSSFLSYTLGHPVMTVILSMIVFSAWMSKNGTFYELALSYWRDIHNRCGDIKLLVNDFAVTWYVLTIICGSCVFLKDFVLYVEVYGNLFCVMDVSVRVVHVNIYWMCIYGRFESLWWMSVQLKHVCHSLIILCVC